MYITLYFIVTRLPDSLSILRDLLLAVDLTDLTVDLLEKHLLAAETSIVAVGASRGTPRTPSFEGCSPSPLVPYVPSVGAVEFLHPEEVGAASAPMGVSAAAGAREARVVGVAAVEAVVGAVEAMEVVAVGVVVGVEALVAAVVAAVVAVVAAGVGVAAVGAVAGAVVAVGVEVFRGEVLAVARGSSTSVRARPLRPSSFVSGLLSVGRLGVVFVARASHCFLCDSTTVTPLPAPVAVRMADPSEGPVFARSSTVLPCPAVPLSFGTTALVTPPYHAFVAFTLISLSLVFPGLCLPSHPCLPRHAFYVSRGGSAPLLTPPRFPR
ncbi:unnamed protein product [Closterium sp. NIES-65]|nr:unnamed protein product [Closterium sp. NIES-65]